MPSPTISCPACGGPIHAIASRCKHCKTDVVTFRARAVRAARELAQASGLGPQASGTGAQPSVATTGSEAGGPRPEARGLPPAAAAAAYQTVALAAQPRPMSAWSRRWPVVVAAVALVVIGLSVGILVERWRTPPTDARIGMAPPAVSPHQVPDDMPSVPIPVPPQPDIAPDPAPQPPVAPPPAPPPPTNAPSVDLFAAALTQTLCDKFKECGLDGQTTAMICEMLDKAVHDELAAKGSQCAYDPDAGQRCLGAIRALQCDAGAANGDMIDWLMAASSLADCTSAYQCE